MGLRVGIRVWGKMGGGQSFTSHLFSSYLYSTNGLGWVDVTAACV